MGNSGIDISVIVPCRNEAGFIRETISGLYRQEGIGTDFHFEVLIVDGCSTDRTREIVEEEALSRPNLKLVLNEKKITPVAFNLGIQNARGSYVCILGAHSAISPDYLVNCLRTIRKVDADNVGGPWKAKGKGYRGEAIALAFQSRFAVGAAKSHVVDYEGYTDSVWGGFYKREVFDRIGLFDEAFVRNQDDELNLRLVRSGGKIWQSATIRFDYFCRNRFSLLWRQYLQYGYWKVRVIRKHKIPASPRHLVPGAFILTMLFLLASSPFGTFFRISFLGLAGAYTAALLAGALLACAKPDRLRYLPVIPFIFAIFHFGYGFGFLKGLLDGLLRKTAGDKLASVTR